MVDRQTVEGIIMELDAALDNYSDPAYHEDLRLTVEALRDRLKFVLDNTPQD